MSSFSPMLKSIVLTISLAFTINVLQANSTFRYLEIHQNEIEIGTYQGKGIKKKNPIVFPLKNLDIKEVKKALLENISDSNNPKVLYYFHSLYGGVSIYHRNTIKKMHSIEDVDLVVSVIWHTEGLSYKNSYLQAYETGKSISTFVGH